MNKKNDGLINWVEPSNMGFLPQDIENDTLSVMLRLLIAKVKEDHATMQYRKELKHYAREIVEIIKFVKLNGYKPLDVNKSNFSLSNKYNESKTIHSSTIVDGNSPSIIEEINFNNSKKIKNYSEIIDG